MDPRLPKLTTPRLVIQRDELLIFRRSKILDAEDYAVRVRSLQREQLRVNKRGEKLVAQRKAVKEAKVVAKKVSSMEKRDALKVRSSIVPIYNERYDGGGDDTFWRIYGAVKGRGAVRLVIYAGSFVKFDETIDTSVPYQEFRLRFLGSYESNDFVGDVGDRILILEPTQIVAKRLTQAFREGLNHCVFEPILITLRATIANSKSKETVKKHSQAIRRVEAMALTYDAGVPESAMESVAVSAGFKIIIHDILGQVIETYNVKKHNLIELTNTRPNHVEFGKVCLHGTPIYISQEALVSMWRSYQAEGKFYEIVGDIKNGMPRRLVTLTGVYEVTNEDHEMFLTMDKTARVKDWKLDAMKHPDVNDFIKSGRIINSWCLTVNDKEATGHIDMPKAYAQFGSCKSYRGFLGKIHQWRSGSFDRVFMENHIGYYRFRILRCDDIYLRAVGLVPSMFGNEWYVLPSAEILYYMDCGMVIETNAGVWGSRMDFEFTPEMLENRRYCVWAGRLGIEKKTKSYSFSCDETWASHLAHQFGSDNVFYWKHDGIVSVKVPVKHSYTNHHILGFITAYTRIQVIEKMRTFALENICKVVMDGIHFTGPIPSQDGIEWKIKELKDHKWKLDSWFTPSSVKVSWSPVKLPGDTMLMGQGGSGKTYSILTDAGFNDVLFVSPTHVLGKSVLDTYGAKNTTIHKLIGISVDGKGCRPYREEFRIPSVILIDELTQIPGDWVEKARSMYPECLFFFAGDMDEEGRPFQCAIGEIWKPSRCSVVSYTDDRRSLDSSLKELKLSVRSAMRDALGTERPDLEMRAWAKANLPIVSLASAKSMMTAEDFFLSGTNAMNDTLLEAGIVSGYYKKGGHISKEPLEGFVKRGSFTYHSIQGSTIENGRVFIILDDIFDYAMLYTGISRVRHMSQVVFVSVS